MPIYEYVCKQCGKLTDVLQKMSDPPPEACPGCGAKGPLEKVISRTSFVLKGGGWYSDLYGSSKKEAKKEGGDSAPASTTAPPSTGGDKPASSTPAPAASSTGTDKK